ncbi:MAG: sigma-54 dependent transcriptional regulator [Bacteroidales bacterium]|jgi:transcriptional regulator with PAS, ATPase and Fis domain|nr:sigma-54 dependent transcriptional regulator [Bacteroidales bacterium]
MFDIQTIKQRYNIIGNSPQIERAIRVALQVAATDLTVLITGESGVGKENFPKIIHQNSARKHGQYIAVNCGAIPEGTIDSELFGHEKGSFTGATDARKGYFEQSSGGTIFLDEVAELPMSTQVRLLRVLETGEFMRVGSSKMQKTDVRVVAATNVNIPNAIAKGKFREDLYYRLNTVPIYIPPIRERKSDVLLLFKKFSVDFSQKYRMPPIVLSKEAEEKVLNYSFPGNVRQLKNLVEQISIIEQERNITIDVLKKYIPEETITTSLSTLKNIGRTSDVFFERELVFKFLSEMQKDISDLKKKIAELTNTKPANRLEPKQLVLDGDAKENVLISDHYPDDPIEIAEYVEGQEVDFNEKTPIETEILSLQETEKALIKKALSKNNGHRKDAANDLGISERTLYRKLNEYHLEE